MRKIEKTVFLSYRRSDIPWALAIFQYLTQHGYDVFFDYKGIASGDFERIILENIRARAHFLVLLTPSALERCNDPADWLRREIETALANRRNIVPILLQEFDFRSPGIDVQLVGELSVLKKYNGLTVPPAYFNAAMDRLREYLNIPLDAVLHPASRSAQRAATQQKVAANLDLARERKAAAAKTRRERLVREKDAALAQAKREHPAIEDKELAARAKREHLTHTRMSQGMSQANLDVGTLEEMANVYSGIKYKGSPRTIAKIFESVGFDDTYGFIRSFENDTREVVVKWRKKRDEEARAFEKAVRQENMRTGAVLGVIPALLWGYFIMLTFRFLGRSVPIWICELSAIGFVVPMVAYYRASHEPSVVFSFMGRLWCVVILVVLLLGIMALGLTQGAGS